MVRNGPYFLELHQDLLRGESGLAGRRVEVLVRGCGQLQDSSEKEEGSDGEGASQER
jgi:hypothetical protein